MSESALLHTCTRCRTLSPSVHPRCLACGEPTPGGPIWRARAYGEHGRIDPQPGVGPRRPAQLADQRGDHDEGRAEPVDVLGDPE